MMQDNPEKNMPVTRERQGLKPVPDAAARDIELEAAMLQALKNGATLEELVEGAIDALSGEPDAQKELIAVRDQRRTEQHEAQELMNANGAPKFAQIGGSRVLASVSPLADRLTAFGTADRDFATYMEQRIRLIVGDETVSANGLLAAIKGMGVRNEGQALLAGQYAAMAHMALQLLADANNANTSESRTASLKMAARLADASQNALDALRRESRQAPALNVGTVNVTDGGQAIVGHVDATGKRNSTAD